jgi:hypothetical protein
LVTLAALSLLIAPCVGATIGPLDYNDFADSPFRSQPGIEFFLEDFSQGVDGTYANPFTQVLIPPLRLTTSGARVTHGTFWERNDLLFFSGFLDRVNGLDRTRLSFEFDKTELNWLPQSVGFVTSNAGSVTIDFYGPDNTIVETLSAPATPLPEHPDLTGLADAMRTHLRPRFFGAIHIPGISRVDITAAMRSTFIDDIQYGRLTPEPPASALVALAVAIRLVRRRAHPQGRLRPFFAQRY